MGEQLFQKWQSQLSRNFALSRLLGSRIQVLTHQKCPLCLPSALICICGPAGASTPGISSRQSSPAPSIHVGSLNPYILGMGGSGEALPASRGQHCSACCAPGHPKGTCPFSFWKAGSALPVQVTDSSRLSPALLGWRKSGMLVFVPGSRRSGSCPALPIVVKIKKQLKILVKRQECPQKKPIWQHGTGEAPGISSQTFLPFWHKSLTKKPELYLIPLPCDTSCHGAMERPLRFLGKTKQSRQLSCQIFPLENQESSDPG